MSVAAPQVSVTDVSAALAPGFVTAPGAMPSRTCTTAPAALDDSVVIEIFETGSVIVRPTVSGASLRSLVAGVVSSRSVAWGEVVGLAVPLPSRIVTPVVTAEPAVNESKML